MFPLCDACRSRVGTIHVQKVFQGRGISYYVCPDCAGMGEFEMLKEMGVADENDILVMVSRIMDMPFIDLNGVEVDPSLLVLFPKKLIRKFRALPVTVEDNVVVVVFTDPFDVVAFEEFEEILEEQGFAMRGAIGSEADVVALIERFYGSSE